MPIALDDEIIPKDNSIPNDNDNKIEINNEPKISTKSNSNENKNNNINNNANNKKDAKIVDATNLKDLNIPPGVTPKVTINDNWHGPKIKKDIKDPMPLRYFV